MDVQIGVFVYFHFYANLFSVKAPMQTHTFIHTYTHTFSLILEPTGCTKLGSLLEIIEAVHLQSNGMDHVCT